MRGWESEFRSQELEVPGMQIMAKYYFDVLENVFIGYKIEFLCATLRHSYCTKNHQEDSEFHRVKE